MTDPSEGLTRRELYGKYVYPEAGAAHDAYVAEWKAKDRHIAQEIRQVKTDLHRWRRKSLIPDQHEGAVEKMDHLHLRLMKLTSEQMRHALSFKHWRDWPRAAADSMAQTQRGLADIITGRKGQRI